MGAEGADAPLSLAQAVKTIDQATHFAEPVRRRAEGVTIAMWGFVSACIVLSNGVLDDVFGFYDAGGWRRLVSSLLWIPWGGLGVLATMAIWRMAEISARQRIEGLRRSPTAILLWLAALLAIVFLVGFVVPTGSAGVAIVGAGLAWTAVGAMDLYKATPQGRRTLIATGIVIAAIGATYGVFTAGLPHDGWDGFEVAAVASMALVPIASGLLQALRG